MGPATVILTDHAWPDSEIEREIIESAGYRLVAPYTTATADEVDALVAREQPSAVMTCWAPVSDRAIGSAAALRIVARMGVGLDNIGVAEASRRGIWVTNVPDYCVEEVSDHAIALALSLLRGVVALDREVHSGRWNPGGARLLRLASLTAGIVGYGRIGRRTAEKLQGLGMEVLALQPRSPNASGGATLVGMPELQRAADVLFLHVPLTPETHHLVDREFIGRMKRGSVVVNVSRGAVVDTRALMEALASGQLGGAALDVLETEPQVPAELLAQGNVVVTPHVGFSSTTSIVELRTRASEEVVRVLEGGVPRHACNQPAERAHD